MTKTVAPSPLTATPYGKKPTPSCFTTVWVVVSIAARLLSPLQATYRYLPERAKPAGKLSATGEEREKPLGTGDLPVAGLKAVASGT